MTLVLREWLLRRLFGAIEDGVYFHAKCYFDVVAFTIPAIESGKSIFRTMNDTKTTMVLSLIMNAINVAGNFILIYAFHLGARLGNCNARLSLDGGVWMRKGVVNPAK